MEPTRIPVLRHALFTAKHIARHFNTRTVPTMRPSLLLAALASATLMYAQQRDTIPATRTDTAVARIFQLGEVTITAMRPAPGQDRVTAATMEAQARMDVVQAMNLLPGITATSFGRRNESMVTVRGFDLRQVPVYMDGIPVYVPYDGYVDLGRFTTADLAAVDVSRGFSSVLYGPNSLGGAINLVSRRPEKKFEFDGAIGSINDNGYRANLNLGTKQKKFFVQGGWSYLHRDAFILPQGFAPTLTENGGQRENSYRTDGKINLKLGWTPNADHEYVLGYINQQGAKGNPPYSGADAQNSMLTKPRYWQWPQWDKETYYFLSNTRLSTKDRLRARLYYDRFKNEVDSYDNATYTTQNKPYAFQSFYNDYTIGGGIEYGTTWLPKHDLKVALQYKSDVHREHDKGEPVQRFEDNTFTAALEDSYRITEKLLLIPGVSFSTLDNARAEELGEAPNTVVDYPAAGAMQAYNGQIGLFHYLKGDHRLGASVSHKTRFATIKDRYSYRMGTAIPNPTLDPETALNYEVNYQGKLYTKITLYGALFLSSITDVITSVDNVEPGKSQMRNAGRAEHRGVEAGVQVDIRKNLLLVANYTYIERRNLSHPEILFTDVPNTKVFGSLRYRPMERLQLLASAEHNSSRYSTSYGTRTGDFTLVNAFVSGRVWKYASVELGLNNVFDTNYSLVEGYPGEGRTFLITLRFFNNH